LESGLIGAPQAGHSVYSGMLNLLQMIIIGNNASYDTTLFKKIYSPIISPHERTSSNYPRAGLKSNKNHDCNFIPLP
jgi:hypothetical protein